MVSGYRPHWREYLIEVGALGTFMLTAASMSVLIEHPSSPLRQVVSEPAIRRVLMGTAMGLTAASIIYSPWGRRSGAHMNPAVTLTFLRLGKIARRDAAAYMTAQFIGGVIGITLGAVILRPWIADPAINYVTTVPGIFGHGIAFTAEIVISFTLMLVVLSTTNRPRIAPFTGAIVAVLIATFITFEAPLSGMSMNPARTFGPDVVSGIWRGIWIYFVAPPLGMLAAAELFVCLRGHRSIRCAKLHHDQGPCIFNCSF
jgi:aquaporin Z